MTDLAWSLIYAYLVFLLGMAAIYAVGVVTTFL